MTRDLLHLRNKLAEGLGTECLGDKRLTDAIKAAIDLGGKKNPLVPQTMKSLPVSRKDPLTMREAAAQL